MSTVMPLVAADLGDLAAVRLGLLGVLPRQHGRDRRVGRLDRSRWARPADGRPRSACSRSAWSSAGWRRRCRSSSAAAILQGLGAGAIPPIAYVSIGRALPDELRPRMFAVLSTAWVLPGSSGRRSPVRSPSRRAGGSSSSGCCRSSPSPLSITLPALAWSVPPATDARHGGRPLGVRTAARPGARLAGRSGRRARARGRSDERERSSRRPAGDRRLALILPGFQRLTPPGHSPARSRAAGRGPPARRPDVHVLRRRCLRARSPSRAGAGSARRSPVWPSRARRCRGPPAPGSRPGRIADWGVVRLVRSGFVTVVVGIVAFALILAPERAGGGRASSPGASPGSGWASPMRRLSLTMLREAPPGAEGAATSGLQLSDVLGTALGTGVGGALIAFGVSGGRGALGRAARRVHRSGPSASSGSASPADSRRRTRTDVRRLNRPTSTDRPDRPGRTTAGAAGGTATPTVMGRVGQRPAVAIARAPSRALAGPRRREGDR